MRQSAAQRAASGYRVYSLADVHTLQFTQRARDMGFSVEQMRSLLSLWQDRDRASADVKAVVMAHVAEFDAKIAALQSIRDTLMHLASYYHGDARPDCPILEDRAEGRATD